jgi:hypothetical protein
LKYKVEILKKKPLLCILKFIYWVKKRVMERNNLTENQEFLLDRGFIPFGWKHLLLRTAIIGLFSLVLGYLQAIGVILLQSPESKLIVPALFGLVFSLINWSYLVRISIVLLPLWFAASTALAHAGVLFIGVLEMPYDQTKFWWIDLLIEFIPPLIAGHWMYSGYSRMAKGVSFWGWFVIVSITLLSIFLLFRTELSYLLLQGFYHTFLCAALCLLHFGKEKSRRLLF